MVAVGYGRGRVGSELSQLGSRWFFTLVISARCLSQ